MIWKNQIIGQHELPGQSGFCRTLIFQTLSATAESKEDKLRPPNLDFSGLNKEIDAYIESVDEKNRAIEKRRIGIVKNFKKMVVKVLSRKTYEGRISLKSKTLQGSITKEDDTGINIKTDKENVKAKWEDINPRLYADIFIAAAVDKAADLSVNNRANSEEAFKKAGNYYFALSVFYDWYNNPAASKLFRKKALILNPELKADIEKMWPVQEVSKKTDK